VVQAKAQTDELDDLARLVDAAADISQLEAAVARTDQIQRSLVALDASTAGLAPARPSITLPWRSRP
ncbi:MAG TPA: hypothetical protein VH353_05450, partial [Caulobacteraceae bacterium]|nr:hypothetical protein [Caulobacteraceae bacterium]